MNEFLSQTGYWLVPLAVGAALIALAWFGARQYFWRTVLCVTPLVLACIVTFSAWANEKRLDINVGPVQTLTEAGPFTRAVDFYSTQPIIDPQAVKSAAAEWFKNKRDALERQQKNTIQEPSGFYEVEGLGANDGTRYDRVRLKFRIWAEKDSPQYKELASSQGNELVAAVASSLAPRGYRFNLGVDLAGGTILVYEVDRDWYANMQKEGRGTFDSANLAAVLKRRIDPANLLEITIRPIKTEPPRVEIILPVRSGKGGVQSQAEIERVKSLVSQVGKLEFRILADAGNDDQAMNDAKALAESAGAAADLNNLQAPVDYAWVELDLDVILERKLNADTTLTGAQRRDGTLIYHAPTAERPPREPAVGRYFILTKLPPPETTVTGEDLTNAHPYVDPQTGRWVTHFSVKAMASERMYDLTQPAVQRWLAVIMDSKVQSYAQIREPLRDSVQVTMGSGNPGETKRKVDRLVQVLQSGSLPATLRQQPVSELTMGPGLGQDTIDRGTTAVIIGFCCVVGFMIFYYRFAGFVASTALTANLLLTVGFMVAVKAAFTLPGLAGLVLMVGMAVDSNVLIYERIRDERQRGATLALAIRNGYNLSLPVIIDTHLTSIFTAIVLYAVGNDQLKGFGVSLAVGLVISLFTALTMTRLLFDLFLAKGWLKHLRMSHISWFMKLFGWPNIDFMKWRNHCFIGSVVLAVVSLVVVIARGEKGLNIDFTGGTAYHFVFKQPHATEKVREQLSEKLPDVNIEAIARGSEIAGRSATEFVVRTTLRDEQGRFNPEEVRKQVELTFPGELVEVQVAAGPITKPADAKQVFSVDLTANDQAIAPARLRTVVENWFTTRLDARQPTQFYQIVEKGQAKDGLYDTVQLNFTVPEDGTAPNDLVQTVTTALSGPKSDRLENFDSQLAAQIQQRALMAIALSWLVISLFLWFRFGSWAYGLAAVLCLIHDVLVAIGMIVLASFLSNTFIGTALMFYDFKLDLPAIAALLTLVGYTVNDKIVVFERIREVKGKSPVLTPQMINETLNQTLSRTLLTGITVLLVLLTLYVAGGEGVHLFSFIMLVGIVIGTYSSVYVASPLLLMLGEGSQPERVRSRLQPQQAGV